MAKKLSQPSLMDKGFLTHYMICKYIDDLPNSWCTEELTNATGDVTCTAGNESLMETDVRNEHAFSTKGLNDGASACGGGEAMTHESASVSTDDRREKINTSKFVDPVFLGDEQPALSLALPPPTAHMRSSNRQYSPDCLLMGHAKTPPMTPPPLRSAILSRPTEEEIMHITEVCHLDINDKIFNCEILNLFILRWLFFYQTLTLKLLANLSYSIIQ